MAWKWWDGFDKRLCGDWISEKADVFGNQLRIFFSVNQAEDEVKVSIGFNSHADKSEALYVEYSQNALYFFVNELKHRIICLVTVVEEDLLQCKLTINNCFGVENVFETDLQVKRLSKSDIEALNKEFVVVPKDMERLQILREFADYGDIKLDAEFVFKNDERENLLDIIKSFGLDELVKDKKDSETVIILMNWLCSIYKHGNPPNGLPSTRTPHGIMEAAKEFNNKTNCRGLSIMLSQIIRAFGIKAYHVTCSPYEEPFVDCHVIVSAFCRDLNKQILLDPTSNLYLKNDKGQIISIEEFRDILLLNGTVVFNDDCFDNTNVEDYKVYMAKNLIRIERYLISSYGNDFKGGYVILVPQKYYQNEAKGFAKQIQEVFVTDKEWFWNI